MNREHGHVEHPASSCNKNRISPKLAHDIQIALSPQIYHPPVLLLQPGWDSLQG